MCRRRPSRSLLPADLLYAIGVLHVFEPRAVRKRFQAIAAQVCKVRPKWPTSVAQVSVGRCAARVAPPRSA